MHYIGLMSGTSVDGIDAALVRIEDPARLDVLATHHSPYPADIRAQVQALASSPPWPHATSELQCAAELDMALGRLFAEAAVAVLQKTGLPSEVIHAIGSHGQTVRHGPGAYHPYTVQIGNPSLIAEHTGITTVADFRAHDLAAGGQGAPLVPAFHQWLFQTTDRARVIVNIGGIANITYLPADARAPVIGFDTGPGNTLLDLWNEQHQGSAFDRDGNWAAGGTPSAPLLTTLLRDPYFFQPPPKSTGREHFHLQWLNRHLGALAPAPAPVDVQATLAELTAQSITHAIETLGPVDEVYVCGGGAHNRNLMTRLGRALAPRPVADTARLALDPDWVEAVAFAWLAHRTMHGQPGNLPSVTGARRAVVLGGIYRA
jgi:anhydro-N-acetylmuramic acid kinase